MGTEEWIAIEDAAAYLAIPIRTLYRLAQRGQLPATKVGRTWRFKRSQLDSRLSPGDLIPAGEAMLGVPEELESLEQMTGLADLSMRLSGMLDWSQIAEFVCERLVHVFAVQGAVLMRLQRINGAATLSVVGSAGEIQGMTGLQVPVDSSPIIQRLSADLSSLVLEDLPAQTTTSRDMILQLGLRSAVLAPISSEGALVGAMGLVSRDPRRWRALEVERLVAVAGQTSTALENARLLRAARRWTEQLEGIQGLSRQLNRSRDVKEVGEAVAREIETLIPYDGLRFYVLEQDGITLEAITLKSNVDYYAHETPDLVRLRLGEGLGGSIAVGGVPEIVRDVVADPRMQDIPGSGDVPESMIVVPFRFEDQVVGVLELSRLGVDAFDPSDLRLMQILGAQAAVALVNARQVGELERRSGRLEQQLESQQQLLAITERLLQTREPQQIFEGIADTLSQVVPCDTLTIYLVDQADDMLRPVLARDQYAEQILQSSLKVGQGITGWAVQHGEAQLVNDAINDPRVAHVPGTPQDEEEALIVVPLITPVGVIGSINLYRMGRYFEREELDLAKLYANYAAIALDNAQIHDKLRKAAQTDPLTGLPHHGTFQRVLAEALSTWPTVSVLMIDLDDFKGYNDRYGHPAGDRLLQRFAARIVDSVRREDTVCRYGGDEIAVVLPDTDEVGARAAADKILHATRGGLGGGRFKRVAISLGIASYPTDAHTPRDLIAIADTALYMAKQSGKGRAFAAGDLPTHMQRMHDRLEELMQGWPDQAEKTVSRAGRSGNRRRADAPQGTLVSLLRPLHELLSTLSPRLAADNEAVAELCRLAAPALGITGRELDRIVAACLVSDMGRLALREPHDRESGPLVTSHPAIAARLLERYPALAGVAQLVRHHHERWDGTGYPDELAGDAVPAATRLMGVAERYVSLTRPRDGTRPLAPREAARRLREEAGTRLAPDAVWAVLAQLRSDDAPLTLSVDADEAA